MRCIYCDGDGAHPGTRRCSDATACDLRVAQDMGERLTARIAALEAQLAEMDASTVPRWQYDAAVAAEREACAALVDSVLMPLGGGASSLGMAIRGGR